MASLNKLFLMGNLTREPELRYTSGGAAVCGFGLAINRRYSTASGEQREEVCFVDIDVWGKQGESCKNYLRKGAPVFIEGRLRMDSWQDRESGKTRTRLTVTAERVQFLGTPRGGEFGGGSDEDGAYDSQPGDGGYPQQYAPPPPQQYAPQPQSYGPPRQAQPQQRPYGQPAARPSRPPQAQPPPPQQMPAFEQPEGEGDTLDDIPF